MSHAPAKPSTRALPSGAKSPALVAIHWLLGRACLILLFAITGPRSPPRLSPVFTFGQVALVLARTTRLRWPAEAHRAQPPARVYPAARHRQRMDGHVGTYTAQGRSGAHADLLPPPLRAGAILARAWADDPAICLPIRLPFWRMHGTAAGTGSGSFATPLAP